MALYTNKPCIPTSNHPPPYQTNQYDTFAGYTKSRTSKPPSEFLLTWLRSEATHGYEFDEDVLFGLDPDTQWITGCINQPNSWGEVAKCLQSEIDGQKALARSRLHKDKVQMWYWRQCINAFNEVVRFYLPE